MGALHDGHLEHLRLLALAVDVRICSIFVNPAQFAAGEDLAKYPRDLKQDSELLAATGCDALFTPNESMMYPDGFSTWVTVEGLSTRYEGEFRPTHFRGVSTVVCKLLNLVQPDVMTLGEKDAQQLRVVERMVEDLNMNVSILPVPIRRDPDGLAMSSRNRYLSPEERERGLSIYRALKQAYDGVASGMEPARAAEEMRRGLADGVIPDYCEIVDRNRFAPPDADSTELLAIIAARVGTTRLIDNMRMPAVETL